MRTLTVLICLFLMACSSTPKEEKVREQRVEPEKNSEVKSIKRETPRVTLPEESRSTEKSDPYTQLSKDIASRSDERVLNTTTEVLSHDNRDVKTLNALAMHHYEMGRIGLSRTILNRALSAADTKQEKAVVYNNLGLLDMAEGKQHLAIAQFKKALENDADNYDANVNLGTLYVLNEAQAKALPYLKKAYARNSKDTRIANNYAIALRDAKNYTLAQEIYKSLLSDQPSNPVFLLNYSILLIDYTNQYREGLDTITRLRSIGPENDIMNRINELEKKAKAGLK